VRISPFHAKYYAYDLVRRAPPGADRLSAALFDAAVDLNPHQIEAAVFALANPLAKGVILADEVGLGKTIEAGIVLCQYWAERRRRLLVICPAAIRKQWAMELEEKFHLPATVVDSKAWKDARKAGRDPLAPQSVLVMSFNFAARIKEELRAHEWDMVVIDEAHKLRNSYRPSNKVGQAIRWATEDSRKVLLTATPLQNSLLELYGLSSVVDDQLFGDVDSFRSQFTGAGADLPGLKQRLAGFCKRTLRKDVAEYVRYTERQTLTRRFTPTDQEHDLYEAISAFLQREDSYALPRRQRHLTALILRKLLASSPLAIAATLDKLRDRLEGLSTRDADDAATLVQELVEADDLETDLLDELLSDEDMVLDEGATPPTTQAVDPKKLRDEVSELQRLADWARRLSVDTKSAALLTALQTGLEQMATTGAARKALVFTESRRTQEYLREFLEANGYAGQVVLFNGSQRADVRAAFVEDFRNRATILVATEAAAEGINLQFCSLVVNYDLPWNPQRIEQRIGRCHRYGQRHDVVVINFLNERNEADARVLQLLTEKFRLFDGIFGASDEVLGALESGIDFEKRILSIYQQCRTPEEIDSAFRALQVELDEQIQNRLSVTRRQLLEHFDPDVHERLRLQLADTRARLDRLGQRFWSLTRHMLVDAARFDDRALAFDLDKPPSPVFPSGRYFLISKSQPAGTHAEGVGDTFLYRLSHPLGEHVIASAQALETPFRHVRFDITSHPTRLSLVEALRGQFGYLTLRRLTVESYETEEYLLFSGFTDDRRPLDQETMEKLFLCGATWEDDGSVPGTVETHLAADAERHGAATISRSLEANNRHFQEARERLERWADDLVHSAEKALDDTKEEIKVLRREARQATTLAEQHDVQARIGKLERQQRRQRQEIFKVEDEIMTKRDQLVDQLEKRLAGRTTADTLFTIRWTVA
jgi:superfamily II DNA or RNA helicase